MNRYQAGYPAAAGSDDGPGANYSSPTMGNFVQQNTTNVKRFREANAVRSVISEARSFHERQAHRYGVDTNRGIAHFKASKMYAREGKLQEMLDQMNGQGGGGEDKTELDELPPKAVMKAHKAAAQFHKSQADKAGLDSDLGHAHVAAMEQHLDTFKKAKSAHQASKGPKTGSGEADMDNPDEKKQKKLGNKGDDKPQSPVPAPPAPGGMMPAVASKKEANEGGHGSGRHKGSGSFQKGDMFVHKGETYVTNKADRKGINATHLRSGASFDLPANAGRESGREAAGGHGSKQSPMPVPKKSDMKNGDIKTNKPPVNLKPEDANKPGMGGGQQGMTRLVSQKAAGEHAGMIKASKKSSVESRLRAFESNANCVKSAKPSSVRDQMEDDLIFKSKRQKMQSGTAAVGESRRRRSL